jgi:NAD(P)-dependent dehydrogenase (short-subunit alcohol dehydrogenase family)
MRFDGKVAIVTGSGQGIGKAIAMALAAEGAKVVTNNRKAGTQGGDAATVAAEIKAAGGEVVPFFGNVSDYDEAKKLIQMAVSNFGKIDILVNNAGISLRGPFINYTVEQIDAVIDIDIKGCIYCCQHVIPYMAKQRYGKIVNISSGAGLKADPMISIYSAAKYAILGLTEALAAELAYYNINVNAVCPGGVRTAMNMPRPGKSYTDNFFRREITPEDIAAGVLFLASDEARNITSYGLPVTAGQEKPIPAPEPYFTV